MRRLVVIGCSLLFWIGLPLFAQDLDQIQKEIDALKARLEELNEQMKGASKAQYDLLIEEYNKNKEQMEALMAKAAAILAEGDKKNEAKVAINAGLKSLRLGQNEEAIQSFDKAISLDPEAVKAYVGKASALRRLKRYAEAEAAYLKAIALDPQDATIPYNLGILYSDQNKYDQALAQYREALAKDSTMAKAYYQIGLVYNEQKEYEKAVTVFRKAIKHDPNYDLAYHALGVALIEIRQYNEAITALQQAIALNPRFGSAYYNLAKALNHIGRHQEAIQAAQQAITQKKELMAAAQIEIGEAYEKLGDKAKALAAFEEAAKDRRFKTYADYKIEQLKKM